MCSRSDTIQYDAFTSARDFSEFASTGDGGISLEQIHNGIHWDGGCGGQFLAAEFSAFDPLLYVLSFRSTYSGY